MFDWPEVPPFDLDRKKVYESTFSLFEDDVEDALDAYVDRRLESFTKDIQAKLKDVIDPDELPWWV